MYSVADMIIVGRLCGTEGITGVNIGSQINILVTGTAFGLAVGGTILIAQYAGAKKFDEQRKTIGTLVVLYAIIAVAATALMLLLGDRILILLNTPQEAFKQAHDYYYICMSGLIFMFAYNVISAVLRGLGDSKRPLYFVAVATAVNVVFDIILVGPFNMGAAGAAYATVGAQALSVVLSLIYLKQQNFFVGYKKSDFHIRKDKALMLIKIGIPSSVQQVVVSFSFLTLTALVNSLPNAVIASACQGIGGKVNSFAVLPAIAMSSAISAMAGQNIGAGEYDRAKKTMTHGMLISFLINVVVFVLVMIFAAPIIGLFDTNEQVIAIGTPYLRILTLDYLFMPFVFCMNGLAIGAGHTYFALINATLSSIIVRVPLAYIMVRIAGLGLNGVALAISLATVSSIILGTIFVASGKWKKSKIRL